MNSCARSWGVPGSGSTVARERVLQLLREPHVIGALLVAPSGYGKTVVAAQYVDAVDRPVLWMTMRGRPAEPETLLEAAASALSCLDRAASAQPVARLGAADAADFCRLRMATLGPEGMLLVLDDCAAPRTGSLVERVVGLYDALSPFVADCVVTCRSLSDEDLRASRGFVIIDRNELAFSREEALRLANRVGPKSPSEAEVLRVLGLSKGHPALLRMMLEHVDLLSPSRPANPGLE